LQLGKKMGQRQYCEITPSRLILRDGLGMSQANVERFGMGVDFVAGIGTATISDFATPAIKHGTGRITRASAGIAEGDILLYDEWASVDESSGMPRTSRATRVWFV
jgi:hypothetical protein